MSAVVVLILVVAAVVVAVVAVRWLRRRLLVVTVDGVSMAPALHPGDRVLVRRTRCVRTGNVVVLGGTGPYRVKRVAAVAGEAVPPEVRPALALRTVPPDALVLLGDNPSASFDSRQAGLFRATDVVGVVIRPIR